MVEKFLDIRRVRDQERQKMRRAGEYHMHVPDTDAHCLGRTLIFNGTRS